MKSLPFCKGSLEVFQFVATFCRRLIAAKHAAWPWAVQWKTWVQRRIVEFMAFYASWLGVWMRWQMLETTKKTPGCLGVKRTWDEKPTSSQHFWCYRCWWWMRLALLAKPRQLELLENVEYNFWLPGWVSRTPKVSKEIFWVVATQIFFVFTPKIGEDEPILTNIFQRGWNHQVVLFFCSLVGKLWLVIPCSTFGWCCGISKRRICQVTRKTT